jgi:membrane-associated phospholipid phosphatase
MTDLSPRTQGRRLSGLVFLLACWLPASVLSGSPAVAQEITDEAEAPATEATESPNPQYEPALPQNEPAVPRNEPALGQNEPPLPDPDDDRPYWRTNLFGRFFSDQKYLFTTWWPSEFRRPAFSAPLLAGVILAVDSSHVDGGADMRAERYAKRQTTGTVNDSAHVLSAMGNTVAGAALIGTGYLLGRWTNHDNLAEASSLSAEALASAGLYTTVLKTLTARTRPTAGGQGDFFTYSPDGNQVARSFPSGHATGAFAVATVFSKVYSEERWVPWVAYGLAGSIGLARIGEGRHFPSDVLVGALLGNSFGRMAVARQNDSEKAAFYIQPYFDPAQQEAGVMWSRIW